MAPLPWVVCADGAEAMKAKLDKPKRARLGKLMLADIRKHRLTVTEVADKYELKRSTAYDWIMWAERQAEPCCDKCGRRY